MHDLTQQPVLIFHSQDAAHLSQGGAGEYWLVTWVKKDNLQFSRLVVCAVPRENIFVDAMFCETSKNMGAVRRHLKLRCVTNPAI